MFVFVEPEVQNDANSFAKYDRSHEALSSVLHQRRLAVTNFVLFFRLITVVCIFPTLFLKKQYDALCENEKNRSERKGQVLIKYNNGAVASSIMRREPVRS